MVLVWTQDATADNPRATATVEVLCNRLNAYPMLSMMGLTAQLVRLDASFGDLLASAEATCDATVHDAVLASFKLSHSALYKRVLDWRHQGNGVLQHLHGRRVV